MSCVDAEVVLPPVPIRVAICHDHTLIREGVRAILADAPGIDVLGTAATVEEATHLWQRGEPDAVVVGVGAAGARPPVWKLRRAVPDAAIVALLHRDGPEQTVEAYRAGATACLPLHVDADRLRDTLQAVTRGDGEAALSRLPHAPAPAADHLGASRRVELAMPPLAGLSRRESEVLWLVADGHTNKEIARHLTLSVRTVQNHLASIFKKLALNDRHAAARYAVRASIAMSQEWERIPWAPERPTVRVAVLSPHR